MNKVPTTTQNEETEKNNNDESLNDAIKKKSIFKNNSDLKNIFLLIIFYAIQGKKRIIFKEIIQECYKNNYLIEIIRDTFWPKHLHAFNIGQ